MTGRKPEPSASKILRGLPGKRKLSADEPAPPPLVDLAPPADLTDEEAAIWNRRAPLFSRLGVLTEADADALAVYCDAFADYVDARKAIRAAVAAGRPKIAAGARVRKDKAFAIMFKLMIEFGMTPSSRSRVHVAPKTADAPASKWAGLK